VTTILHIAIGYVLGNLAIDAIDSVRRGISRWWRRRKALVVTDVNYETGTITVSSLDAAKFTQGMPVTFTDCPDFGSLRHPNATLIENLED
jgi:hypothetical protein